MPSFCPKLEPSIKVMHHRMSENGQKFMKICFFRELSKVINANRETPQLHSKLTFRNIILTIQRGFEKINAWCLAKVNNIIKDFSKQESTTHSKEMMLFFVVDDTSKKILRWSYFNNSTEFRKNKRLMLNKGNWSHNSLFKARVNTTFLKKSCCFLLLMKLRKKFSGEAQNAICLFFFSWLKGCWNKKFAKKDDFLSWLYI